MDDPRTIILVIFAISTISMVWSFTKRFKRNRKLNRARQLNLDFELRLLRSPVLWMLAIIGVIFTLLWRMLPTLMLPPRPEWYGLVRTIFIIISVPGILAIVLLLGVLSQMLEYGFAKRFSRGQTGQLQSGLTGTAQNTQHPSGITPEELQRLEQLIRSTPGLTIKDNSFFELPLQGQAANATATQVPDWRLPLGATKPPVSQDDRLEFLRSQLPPPVLPNQQTAAAAFESVPLSPEQRRILLRRGVKPLLWLGLISITLLVALRPTLPVIAACLIVSLAWLIPLRRSLKDLALGVAMVRTERIRWLHRNTTFCEIGFTQVGHFKVDLQTHNQLLNAELCRLTFSPATKVLWEVVPLSWSNAQQPDPTRARGY